jgi:DNA repair exonuclease SbcCD ATPase subunit
MVMKAIAEDGGDVSDDDTEIDQDELMGFAEHLGLVLPDEQDLMWICKMALNAPVPAGWTAHNDGEGNTYYYNAETGASSWDHPSDPYFRGLLRRCRHLKVSASKGLQGSQAALKANEDLNSQLDKLKDKYNQLKEAAAKVSEENDVTTQRAAALEVELADVHLRHKAEIQALTKVHADLRGQTTSLDALASENAQLKAAAAAASEDLKRYRSGEAIDLRARVTDLETSLRAARADAKSAQLAGEQASAREAELQAQLVTAQSSSIRDKSHINALVLAAEEAHRAAAETARRHQEEVSRMEAEMRRSSAAETNAAREREEEKRRGEAAAAEVTRRLDEATRALELLRAQASQAQEALQEASESAVLKVACLPSLYSLVLHAL